MNKERRKKIKSQKNAAVLLIIVPLIILISYISKSDFQEHGINNYIICGGLLVLIICGLVGFSNSLKKLRN